MPADMPLLPNGFPQESATREVKDLSGLWRIAFDLDKTGEKEFIATDRIPSRARTVAVPGSYNDQFVQKEIRDFIGAAWYYTSVVIPPRDECNWYLRFGSVNYAARVFLDGEEIGGHSGGHYPFTLAVPRKFVGKRVVMSVLCDNDLDWSCIPGGEHKDLTPEQHGVAKKKIENHFDFFHYSGIHRRVFLFSTPSTFVADSTIVTKSVAPDRSSATIGYALTLAGDGSSATIRVVGPDDSMVVELADAPLEGEFAVDRPRLWDIGQGNLYHLDVELRRNGQVVDSYRERFGIRTVTVQGDQFLLNGRPVYFRGFGRHEDFTIYGRCLPDAVLVRDFEMMRWIGANSFRTSHYPYSEEHMDLADEQGVMVIDETPAVGHNSWGKYDVYTPQRVGEAGRRTHERMLEELVARDKNRPAVVMWSVANEAPTGEENARAYFEPLVKRIRSLDPTRPITNVLNVDVNKEDTIDMFDVICVNRYPAWYSDPGELGVISRQIGDDLETWHKKFQMPIILSEFGADTIAGFHSLPDQMFSEEYQTAFLEEFFAVFDKLDFVIGEHIWNFADFMTKQGITRVIGNRKGIFTRDRQPKAAAFAVRRRWKGKG